MPIAGDLERLKTHTLCDFEYLLALTHATSVGHLLAVFDITLSHVLDSELHLVYHVIKDAVDVISKDHLQMASELIGRLRLVKGDDFHRNCE